MSILSPFLNIGLTTAYLSLSGNIPEEYFITNVTQWLANIWRTEF
jgi:hypothetical protein